MLTRFLILGVIVVAIVAAVLRFRGGEPEPAAAAKTETATPAAAAAVQPAPSTSPPPTAPTAPVPAPPKPAAPKLTPEQQAALEAQQEEQDQRDATELLHSVEVEKRLEGAEQLGAFQNPQAEAELVQALSRDTDAGVREAAAQSLASFSPASPDTWKVLLAALEDRNQDVQAAAESSLESLLLEYDEIPKSLDWVKKALKKASTSRKISADTRESLRGLLEQSEDSPADGAN